MVTAVSPFYLTCAGNSSILTDIDTDALNNPRDHQTFPDMLLS